MSLSTKPKRYRFPVSIISYAVWQYHRFNLSFRDVQEQLAFRGIDISHETVRSWCLKFFRHFKDVLQKREWKISDKWRSRYGGSDASLISEMKSLAEENRRLK